MTAEAIAQQLQTLPSTDDTEAALSFIKQPGLVQVPHPFPDHAGAPAHVVLRTYRLRAKSTAKAGMPAFGFPSLLNALAVLPPMEPVTTTVFEGTGCLGIFWSTQTDPLLGFVIVKQRSPEEEQERIDWFRRNIT